MRLRAGLALAGTLSIGGIALLAPIASAATTTTTAPTAAPTAAAKASAAARAAVVQSLQTSVKAKSVTVNGKATQGKETITLSVQATNSSAGTGSISTNGATVHAVRVGANVYFNANSKFWTANGGSAAATLFAGRWVETAATSHDGQPLAEFLDVNTLFGELFSGNINTAIFTKGVNTIVNGVPVVAYTGKDATGGTGGTLYVARTGKPYIIELNSLGGAKGTSSTSIVTFSAYNQPVRPVAPKGAIDLDKLKQPSSG
jgi:hypothetical protein